MWVESANLVCSDLLLFHSCLTSYLISFELYYFFKGQSVAQEVTYDYDNVLARIADPNGLANWEGRLNNGSLTWSKVTKDMTISPEYMANWGTGKVPGNGRPMTCPCYGMTDV